MPQHESAIVGAVLALLGEDAKAEFEMEAWRHRDTDIDYSGTKITLPAHPKPMPLEAAIEALQQKLADENMMMDVIEKVPGYPFDSAVAFVKAMRDIYGWASAVPTPTFWGPKAPDLITVKTGPRAEDVVQVPMGSFRIPGVENDILVHIDSHDGGPPVLCIHGEVRKREHHVIKELVIRTKAILAQDSIYRGKAIRLAVQTDGTLDRGLQPSFLPTDHVRPDELILSRTVQANLDTSLFTLIKHTDACEEHGIPLKRGVLLEGKYGTGKSMTAAVASRVCVENGWTFIMLDNVKGLREALEFAKAYQPAVVFAEDIDRGAEIRDEKTNDLLNVIDGVVTKNSKVITVLTTNHVEKINQAMLRPGRLDAVISVLPPDKEAVGRLVHLYARKLIDDDEPLNRIGDMLAGEIPATIREVVERSKLGMISRGAKRIIEEDLLVAAEGMKRHLELLNKPTDASRTPAEKLGDAMTEIVGGPQADTGLAKKMAGTETLVMRTLRTVDKINADVHRLNEKASATKPNDGVMPGILNDIHQQTVTANKQLAKLAARPRR